MADSLSNLFNNLSEGVNRIKCKYVLDENKCETCEIKYKYCNCFLEYADFKDELIEYKCLCCNKNRQHQFDKKLKERFFNACKFSNHSNKLFLLLQKGADPYEYMDGWGKINEISFAEKEDFYSH